MPSTEIRRKHRSLPIQSFAGWDNVYEINAILTGYERGNFQQGAVLADAFARDDRIDGVLRTRVGALVGSNVDVRPVDKRRKSVKVAEMLGGVEDGPGEWDRIFPTGTLAQILRAGDTLNFGLGEILWTSEGGFWWPRVKVWDTQFVRWDETQQCYLLRTMDGEIKLPRLDENPVGDGKWFIWCPFGYQAAYRHGMLRGLANLYMRRMWVNRDWARYGEAHGMPGRKAIVPAGGDKKQEKKDFFEMIENLHSEPTILCPQGEEGDKYDYEIVEATAKTYETFKDSKTDVNTDIAILLLGQNLTTEATGGGLGDGGAGTHNLVRMDKLKEDAAIASAIRDQILVPFAQFNFGDGQLAPRPVFAVAPPEDENKKASTYEVVGKAVRALKDTGEPIKPRDLLEEFGVPMFTVEEVAAQKAAADAAGGAAPSVMLAPTDQAKVITVNEARASAGLGPLLTDTGAEDEDGKLTVSEYAEKVTREAGRGAEGGVSGQSGPGSPVPPQFQPQGKAPLPQSGEKDANPADPKEQTDDDKKAPALPPKAKAALAAALGKARRRFIASASVTKRYEFQGLPIAVENPAGTTRTWTDLDGQMTGQTHMRHDYGFIEGHLGSDGEELDCYIGPNENASRVHIVHQLRAPAFKVHDEDKVMLGFDTEADARAAYVAHRSDGDAAVGGISVIDLNRFKAKLDRRKGGGKIRS